MIAIQTRGLTKYYKSHAVVNNCSLTIQEGEIYGFIGRNGAGKSTVMKMICGLVTPSAGEVILYGTNVASSGNSLKRIGSLIEQPGLLPTLSARQNLEIKARATGFSAGDRSIDELLDLVQLAGANGSVKGFSLGMRQRLGIAMALVGYPSVLLLDEPLNGLDPQGIRDMRRLFQRLCDERNMTIFISSHILGELEKVATRFGVIHEGYLVAELTASDLEQACVESLIIGTDDPETSEVLLARMLPKCKITLGKNGLISIVGECDRHAVARMLFDASQVVWEFHVERQEPEDYFLSLMTTPSIVSPGAEDAEANLRSTVATKTESSKNPYSRYREMESSDPTSANTQISAYDFPEHHNV